MQLTHKAPSETDPSKKLVTYFGIGFAVVGALAIGYGLLTAPSQPNGVMMPNGQTVQNPTIAQLDDAIRHDAPCMAASPALYVAANAAKAPSAYVSLLSDLAATLERTRDQGTADAYTAAMISIGKVEPKRPPYGVPLN